MCTVSGICSLCVHNFSLNCTWLFFSVMFMLANCYLICHSICSFLLVVIFWITSFFFNFVAPVLLLFLPRYVNQCCCFFIFLEMLKFLKLFTLGIIYTPAAAYACVLGLHTTDRPTDQAAEMNAWVSEWRWRFSRTEALCNFRKHMPAKSDASDNTDPQIDKKPVLANDQKKNRRTISKFWWIRTYSEVKIDAERNSIRWHWKVNNNSRMECSFQEMWKFGSYSRSCFKWMVSF